MKELYTQHLESALRYINIAYEMAIFDGQNREGIIFHAGAENYYHADDHAIHFKTIPMFAWLCPLLGPDHFIIFRPDNDDLKLIRVQADDYWFEPAPELDHPFMDVLDVTVVSSMEEAVKVAADYCDDLSKMMFVGEECDLVDELGITDENIEPDELIDALDYFRAYKSDYEVQCVREALKITAKGHAAARKAMTEGKTERQIHAAYLEATDQMENDVPYGNIIAWDETSATLHYVAKRTTKPAPGHTFMIDAGATCFGYAGDITRSYTRPDAHPVFVQILAGMDQLERQLVDAVAPGVSFVDLHKKAHFGIAQILSDVGIIGLPADEIYKLGLTAPFFPHGLGHHLGIQVHDVGAKQINADGDECPIPEEFPHLRTLRDLEVGHLITIEPGFYFIPMLLNPFREGEHKNLFNWELVDELMPCGGIRIEDNIIVTETGYRDLSRDLIPGHLD